MGTKNYNNYSDMITFTRASSGTALAKISYGAELVTNGTFDTDSDWVKQSGWAISGGQAVGTAVNGYLYPTSISLPVGTAMRLTFDAVVTSGTVSVRLGIFPSVTKVISSSGTYEIVAHIALVNEFSFQGTSFTGTIDNVSIKEVLYDQPDGTLQLFNHPTNQPRVEYDYQGNRLGLLVEEARTNVVTYSEDFTQWSQSQVTISSNAIEAPDGTLTADKTVEDQTNNYHYAERNFTGVGSYTYSIFVKAAERKYAGIHIYDGSHAKGCSIDLETGTLGTPYGGAIASATSFPNGWWRLSVAVTTTGSGKAVVYSSTSNALATYLGDGASGVYIWGAQVEAGSFPTSYIPTSGSTVTRAADVASIGVGAFGYNKTAGTVLIEYDRLSASRTADLFMAATNSAFNPSSFGVHGSSTLSGYVRANNAYVGQVIVGSPNNETTKSALSFGGNNILGCTDGGAVTSNSGLSGYPTTVTEIEFMNLGVTGQRHSGHISSIAYYPRRLTDAQIKALTSPPETPTLSLTFDDSSTSYLETSIHG